MNYSQKDAGELKRALLLMKLTRSLAKGYCVLKAARQPIVKRQQSTSDARFFAAAAAAVVVRKSEI